MRKLSVVATCATILLGAQNLPVAACDGVEITAAAGKQCLKPAAGKTEWFKDCPACPEMVLVPAGEFLMGTSGEDIAALDKKLVAFERQVFNETRMKFETPPEKKMFDDEYLPQLERRREQPQTKVTIARPFAVGRFTVTFAEWNACRAEGGCSFDPRIECERANEKICGPFRKGVPYATDRHPVVNINWNSAKSYVAWLSKKTGKEYRLLSESEWEYVARAGTTSAFWWGQSIRPDQANYDPSGKSERFYNHTGRSLPVDTYPANPWGLYNVHGNVEEWVEDHWNDNHAGNPGDGTARTTGPLGRFGPIRVLRNGGFLTDPWELRAAYRFADGFDSSRTSRGFRVALSLNSIAAPQNQSQTTSADSPASSRNQAQTNASPNAVSEPISKSKALSELLSCVNTLVQNGKKANLEAERTGAEVFVVHPTREPLVPLAAEATSCIARVLTKTDIRKHKTTGLPHRVWWLEAEGDIISCVTPAGENSRDNVSPLGGNGPKRAWQGIYIRCVVGKEVQL